MKPLFGNLFDFNGDDVVTTDEEFLGFMMIQKMQEELENEKKQKSCRFDWSDSDVSDEEE